MTTAKPYRPESIHWHGPYICDNPEHMTNPGEDS